MPKSIAIVLPNLEGGGAERVCLDLARAFKNGGYIVEFLLMEKTGSLLATTEADFKVTGIGVQRIRDVKAPLIHYLCTTKVDGVIANMWPLSVVGVAAARVLGLPVIGVEHSVLSDQYKRRGVFHLLALRATLARSMRRATATVGVSDGVVKDLRQLSFGGSARRIYNPIPAPSEGGTGNDLGWKQLDGPRLLSVGSFKPVKNHALLLDAFALCAQDAQLMLLGQGELEPDLRAKAKRMGLSDRVTFAGFQEDPSPYYRSADICVLSSTREGFGNVLVEAMGCGCQIVSTDCPTGPREILASGQFGNLVGQTPQELVDGIAGAFSDPIDTDLLKARAAEFRPDVIAKEYLSALFG